MGARELINRPLRRLGYELRRSELVDFGQKRQRLIERHGIDLVIDVGANVGQYGQEVRLSGYRGRLVSFEPNPEAFDQLSRAADGDPVWEVHRSAVGSDTGTLAFNVSHDSVSSSALVADAALTNAAPRTAAARSITVPSCRLDDHGLSGATLLKIDTQGYEHSVLDGASKTLDYVRLLEVEMPLAQTYQGGSTVYDLLPRLHDAGFRMLTCSPGFVDPATLQTVDMDVLMVRSGRP